MVEGRDQVLAEIEVVVVHSGGQDKAARPTTVVVEVLGMLKRYQLIFHSMHQESRTCYILYFLDVLEPVLNKIFQYRSSLVLSYRPNTLEARH